MHMRHRKLDAPYRLILVHNLRTLDKLRSTRDEAPANAEKNAA